MVVSLQYRILVFARNIILLCPVSYWCQYFIDQYPPLKGNTIPAVLTLPKTKSNPKKKKSLMTFFYP